MFTDFNCYLLRYSTLSITRIQVMGDTRVNGVSLLMENITNTLEIPLKPVGLLLRLLSWVVVRDKQLLVYAFLFRAQSTLSLSVGTKH